MAYQVFIKDSAQRELNAIPQRFRAQIEGRIQSLAENAKPTASVALKGKKFHGLRRIRSGNYRITYQVNEAESTVIIVRVGDRRDVYD